MSIVNKFSKIELNPMAERKGGVHDYYQIHQGIGRDLQGRFNHYCHK